MITVIKNVNVYAPEKLGIKDIVIVSDKIEGIYDNVNVPNDFVNIHKIKANMLIASAFIMFFLLIVITFIMKSPLI